jgi:hypothetical protein
MGFKKSVIPKKNYSWEFGGEVSVSIYLTVKYENSAPDCCVAYVSLDPSS